MFLQKSPTIPEGDYLVTIEDAWLENTERGYQIFKWKLKVINKEYEGKILYKENTLNSKKSMDQLKRDTRKCGIKIKKGSDLQNRDITNGFKGIILEIGLENNRYGPCIHFIKQKII